MAGWWQNSVLRERWRYRSARLRAWTRRATTSGLALRGVVWATGTATAVLAAPGGWRLLPIWVLAALLALAAAAGPHTAWVSVLVVGPLLLLVAGGLLVGYAPPPGQVALLAGAAYLHHSSAALAAQLRTDTVVPAAVFARWARHAGAVLAVAALVGAAIVALSARAPVWSATAYLLAGVAAAVGAVALLAYLLHRRVIR